MSSTQDLLGRLLQGPRLTMLVLTGLLVCLLAHPAPASAASSLSAPRLAAPEVIVGEPTQVLVGGVNEATQPAPIIAIDVNPVGQPCAASAEANESLRLSSVEELGAPTGTFSEQSVAWRPEATGQFWLCAWLTNSIRTTTKAASAGVVSVRPARTSLELSLPRQHFDENASTTLSVTASSEARRVVSVEINRIGVPCGPTVWDNEEQLQWISDDEIPAGASTLTEQVTTPFSGKYHLCGWIGRSVRDTAPTTVVDGPVFVVGKPRCQVRYVPRRPSGTVVIECSGTTDPITVTATRGRRTFTATSELSMGSARFSGRALGLRRGRRVTLAIRTIDGLPAGRRIVRLR